MTILFKNRFKKIGSYKTEEKLNTYAWFSLFFCKFAHIIIWN